MIIHLELEGVSKQNSFDCNLHYTDLEHTWPFAH